VLAYMNVPHDIPVSADTLRVKRQPVPDQTLADVSDFDPLQSDGNGGAEESAPAVVETAGSSVPTVELAEGEGIPVPQFQGKTVREVTEQCMKLGLSPVLVGTGIARTQTPEPGAMVRSGSQITVQFARGASLLSAAARGKVR
jgi:hypothetical protein